MGKKEIMRTESSSRMEGERPTIVPPTAAPEVMEATGAPRAEATPSPPRREETRLPVVPSTSGGQAPATGTTQTPTIPMDALEMFFKSLRPDLDLSQTLARLAAELTTPKPVQPATVPTPLPIAATITPNTRTTEPSTKEQAKANPTPITHPVKKPSTQPDIPPPSHSISQTLHTDSPPKSTTEKTTDPRTEEGTVGKQGKGDERGETDVEREEIGDDRGGDEGVVKSGGEGSVKERVVGTEGLLVFQRRDREARTGGAEIVDVMVEEEVEGDEVYSGATEVLSEGGTEEIKEKEKKCIDEEVDEGEEVDQPVGHRETVILLTDTEEVNEEEQPTEVAGQRSGGCRDSPVGLMVIRGVGSEDMEEEEESTLIRRPRSRRRPLIVETETQGERQTVETASPKERQEEVPTREAETEEERLRRERKRKGKELARPVKKKVKQASRTVVIQEPAQVTHEVPAEEQSEEEEQELRWERRTKRREDRRQEESLPYYRKTFIKMNNHLLRQMGKFKNQKWQDECEKRVTGGKKAKSGKKLHQPSLQELDAEEKFLEYITGIGFEWLLEIDMPKVPEALAKEFFTSFRFNMTTDLDEECISFRVCDRNMGMNLTEWSVRLGLYSVEQAVAGEWFGRDVGLPKNNPDFDPQSAWRSITHDRAPEYKPTQSRGNHIADPVLRLAQVFLGYNLLGQANTSAAITQAELYFMWCMKEQRKVHLGFWITYACHTIATHSVRHLNVCHLLGAFVRNNLTIEIEEECDLPRMCPLPDPFDLNFFIKVKILKVTRGKLHYYAVGQPERTEERTEHTRGQLALTPRKDDEGDKAAPEDDWKRRTEQLLHQLVQNAEAQRQIMEAQAAQMTRAVNVMEQMLNVVREGSVLQQQEAPSLSTPAQGSRREKPAKDIDPKNTDSTRSQKKQ